MKDFLLSTLLIFCISVIYAQNDNDNISVTSFQKLDSDITARTQKKIDQNGVAAALIKVSTQGDGFVFEGDGLGIVTTEHKIGEYWVYVPYGAKYLIIKHNEMGVLRYRYTEKIEALCTYELKLSMKKATIDGNYLVINIKPESATIYIDDIKQDRDITPLLRSGIHTYRIEKEYYITQEGHFNIDKNNKTFLNVSLERAIGFVNVNYTPNGTEIYDNEKLIGTTPAKIKLEAGHHNLKLKKDKYLDGYETVEITENCNIQLSGELTKSPTGKINITSQPEGASVYIDDKFVGTTNGTYEVLTGAHVVSIRKNGYYDKLSAVMVKSAETRIVNEKLSRTKEHKRDDRINKRYLNNGFRGFVELGYNTPLSVNNFKSGILNDAENTDEMHDTAFVGYGGQFALSLGSNIMPFWYTGIGWAYIYTYTGTNKYCWTSPFYWDNRFEFFNRKISPFVAIKFGVGISYTPRLPEEERYTWEEIDGEMVEVENKAEEHSYNAYQLYFSPSAGIRFWHFSLAISWTRDMNIRDNDFRSPEFTTASLIFDWGSRKK